jgi:hypothetical protein
MIYDQKSAAFVLQIPGGVTDRRRTTDGWCNPALLRPQIGYILFMNLLRMENPIKMRVKNNQNLLKTQVIVSYLQSTLFFIQKLPKNL